MIPQHFGSLRLPSRNPFDLRVKIVVVCSSGSYQIMMLVVPNLLVTLRIIICPIGRRAACSLRGRYPDLRGNTVTHDLYCGETPRMSHIPPLSRSDLVLWHYPDLSLRDGMCAAGGIKIDRISVLAQSVCFLN